MANTKGARKAARQAEKRRKHNASMRSALTSAIKSVTKAIQAGDKVAARKILSQASGIIDRIADKNVIHKNEAARHKSRLAFVLRSAHSASPADFKLVVFREVQ
jgi:small subunit ribosomal protein S20